MIGKALKRLMAEGEPVMLVSITAAKGSTPRAAGARMAVTENDLFGTIGGGHLEFVATLRARKMLDQDTAEDTIELALGPAVGQCCGGRVSLRLIRVDDDCAGAILAEDAEAAQAMPRVLLFGAGHVGRALAAALAPLPVRLLWSDERPDAFPRDFDDTIEIASDESITVMNREETVAAIVVMTYDHGLDFEITEAALMRSDTAYVGLIGSATKRRRFATWFTKRGGDEAALGRLICPIGDCGVADKRPEVIAALVAAEICQKVFPS